MESEVKNKEVEAVTTEKDMIDSNKLNESFLLP
jgi:hypothetical protein